MNVNDPLPTANPFHSDPVRTEVELIRARPVTLDEDAQRVRGEDDEPTLGMPQWVAVGWSRTMIWF